MEKIEQNVTKRIIKIAGQDVEVTYRDFEPIEEKRNRNPRSFTNRNRPFNRRNFVRKESRNSERNVHVNEVNNLNNNGHNESYYNNSKNNNIVDNANNEQKLNSAISDDQSMNKQQELDCGQREQLEQQSFLEHHLKQKEQERLREERRRQLDAKVAEKMNKPGIQTMNRFDQLNVNIEENEDTMNNTRTVKQRKNKKHKKCSTSAISLNDGQSRSSDSETVQSEFKLELNSPVDQEISTHLEKSVDETRTVENIVNKQETTTAVTIINKTKTTIDQTLSNQVPGKDKKVKKERSKHERPENEKLKSAAATVDSNALNKVKKMTDEDTSKWKQYSSFIQKVLLIILFTFILVFISIKLILHYFCPCESNFNLPFPQLFTFR